ncbi:MAG: hypothetical protein L0Y39_10590 [Methylococcaceae bacterium]|nr:hypothetical protein [Methylococcaceae bacterium]
MTSVHDARQVFASRDLKQVEAVARKYRTSLAIVPWPVADAFYQNGKYSVIRISI